MARPRRKPAQPPRKARKARPAAARGLARGARSGPVDRGRAGRATKGGRAERLPAARLGLASARPAARPVYVLTRQALRQVDALSLEQYGLPTIVLMENAAAQLAAATTELLARAPRASVLIVAGRGHNGGDGLALARHLKNADVPVAVVLAAPPSTYDGDPAVHLGVIRRMGVRIAEVDVDQPAATLELICRDLNVPGVVVDALLGTGLDRPVTGVMADLIAGINALRTATGAKVLAVDLPSGMDADTGRGLGGSSAPAVRADVTVSFVGLKVGFASAEAGALLGEVIIADIGAPQDLVRRLGRAVDTHEHAAVQRLPSTAIPPIRRISGG